MLSTQQIIRYEKHIDLPFFGEEKQHLLANKTVTIVGAGGLGCPISLYLASSGVGTINIIDDDDVSLSNLQRQILYTKKDCRTKKGLAAQKFLTELNSEIIYNPILKRLDKNNMNDVIQNSNIIIDATDNFETRYTVNELCIKHEKALLSGAILHYEGQISLFHPSKDPENACYACFYKEQPKSHEVPSCADSAVLSPVAGVIGTLMATEAIKFLINIGETIINKTIFYSALDGSFSRIHIPKNSNCTTCNYPK